MNISEQKAIVLFSGGQDSATCLAWALDCFAAVETVGFAYGQRHAVELECRGRVIAGLRRSFPQWARRLGQDHVLDVSVLGEISDTALTRAAEFRLGENGLPSTFVPGRNLVFFVLAAALAYQRDIRHLVGGMCETDFSGYPDCRDDTTKAIQVAITLGMDRRFVIHTPLMWLDKAETWALAERLGGSLLTDLICEETHSCYLGERTKRRAWGYGCGECPACVLRAKGFERWRAAAGARP